MGDHIDEVDKYGIDLWKLVNQVMPDLQKLIINGSPDTRQFMRFYFPRTGSSRSVKSSLQTIKIVAPWSAMTKNRLNYIISGYFPKLENLDLFLTFQDGKEVLYQMKKNEIWDRLKAFCSTSLKNYNICFRDRDCREIIFSIDNCENDSTRYKLLNRPKLDHSSFRSTFGEDIYHNGAFTDTDSDEEFDGYYF